MLSMQEVLVLLKWPQNNDPGSKSYIGIRVNSLHAWNPLLNLLPHMDPKIILGVILIVPSTPKSNPCQILRLEAFNHQAHWPRMAGNNAQTPEHCFKSLNSLCSSSLNLSYLERSFGKSENTYVAGSTLTSGQIAIITVRIMNMKIQGTKHFSQVYWNGYYRAQKISMPGSFSPCRDMILWPH